MQGSRKDAPGRTCLRVITSDLITILEESPLCLIYSACKEVLSNEGFVKISNYCMHFFGCVKSFAESFIEQNGLFV